MTTTQQPLGKVLEFLKLIREVNHAVETASYREFTRSGVTTHQQAIIRLIGKFPGISPKQLAEHLCADPSTISTAISKLERQGVIARIRDPSDKRRIILALSAKGRALDIPSEGSIEDAISKTLAETPDEQIETTKAVLKSFAKTLLNDPSK